MKPRQLKSFTELDRLSDADRDQLWADLHAGLGYDRAVRHLGAEHFVTIRRHRLISWWQREALRHGLNDRLPESDRLAPADFLKLLNGVALPWSDLMHARILGAAFQLTGQPEPTPSKLLALQRIANNEFHQQIAGERQHIARERLDLERRRLRLREKKERPDRDIGDLADCPDLADLDPAMFEAIKAGRRPKWHLEHHVIQKKLFVNEPASEPSPTDAAPAAEIAIPEPANPSNGGTSAASPISSPCSLAQTGTNPAPSAASPISSPRTPAETNPFLPPPANHHPLTTTHLSPLPTDPSAPFDVLQLQRVTSTPAPGHISRDLSLPLEYRVNFYNYARLLEAGQKSNSASAPPFRSNLQWCPCGRDFPCPDHGNLWSSLAELCPYSSDYYRVLTEHDIPWTLNAATLAQKLRETLYRRSRKLEPPSLSGLNKIAQGTRGGVGAGRIMQARP